MFKNAMLELIEIFKKDPGSAETALIRNDRGQCFVRKRAKGRLAAKLAHQARWLSRRRHLSPLPKVLDFRLSGHEAILDLEYIENAQPFAFYVHSASLAAVQESFFQLVRFLRQEIHQDGPLILNKEQGQKYLESKLLQKIREVRVMSPSLNETLLQPRVVINGREYLNIAEVAEKLQNSKTHMEIAFLSRNTPLHGDFTFENILISPTSLHILDPNDENHLESPMLDFAKILQSIASGYEAMSQAAVQRLGSGEFHVHHQLSKEYLDLKDHLLKYLCGEYEEREILSLNFHLAMHFARLLPYKVKASGGSFWVYYVELVKRLNAFLNLEEI